MVEVLPFQLLGRERLSSVFLDFRLLFVIRGFYHKESFCIPLRSTSMEQNHHHVVNVSLLIHQKIYIAFLKIRDVGGEGSVFGQIGFLRLKL